MQTIAKEAFSQQASLILKPYKERFEKELPIAFANFGPKTTIREAMEYALTGSCKRFRPAIVYMVADALHAPANVRGAALAVEYFHTSSLIADDLPSMDNDDFRRGRATTHKVYGEATALLASYALIASGFEEIANTAGIDATRVTLGVSLAAQTMGAKGLIGGQFYDLNPEKLDREHILKIVDMKTGALFDLSMSLGWIFGGGDLDKLDLVHKAAYHFGVAFQVLDDLDDQEKDKSHNSQINYANAYGVQEAIEVIDNSIKEFEERLETLSLHAEPLKLLGKGLTTLSRNYL